MKIEILPKGLSLTYMNDTSNKNYFIPFTGIAIIGPVKVILDESNYDILAARYFGEYIEKIAIFTIKTFSNDKFDIFINKDIKKFPRKTDKDNISIWKRFFFWIN